MRQPRALAVVAVSILVASCGSDGGSRDIDALSRSSGTPTTTSTLSPQPLVIARRSMSEAENAAVRAGNAVALDCTQEGAVTWEYGPIGPEDARGRKPNDALSDAIRDMASPAADDSRQGPVPQTGWVEIGGQNRSEVYFVNGAHVVVVNGDPDEGVWRHSSAILCAGS